MKAQSESGMKIQNYIFHEPVEKKNVFEIATDWSSEFGSITDTTISISYDQQNHEWNFSGSLPKICWVHLT